MKKLLSLLLAGCMLLGLSTTAFAETYVTESGEQSIPVEYTKYSTYSIMIPEVINLNETSCVFNFYPDIQDSEQLLVKIVSPDFSLTNGTDTYTKTIYKNYQQEAYSQNETVCSYSNGEDYFQYFNYYFDGSDLKAGNWTGTMTFSFWLESK